MDFTKKVPSDKKSKKSWGKDGGMETQRSGKDVLKELKDKRGYLHTHHEFFGYSDPPMLEKYDQLYEHLVLKKKFLDNYTKELVFLGILAVTLKEVGGPTHIKRAREAGITANEMAEVFFLAQIAKGVDALSFVGDKWAHLLADTNVWQQYDESIKNLTARIKISKKVVELIFIGLYSALGKKAALRFHLCRANKYGLQDEEIYEAMSYIMIICGGPAMIDAADVLKDVLKKGQLKPQSVFKSWVSAMRLDKSTEGR